MSAFVCAKEHDDEFGDNHHTSFAMVRCTRCGKHAVGGYWCDCGHDDVDPADQLTGHGPGHCQPKETTA